MSNKTLLVDLGSTRVATAIVVSSLSAARITEVVVSSPDQPRLPKSEFDSVLATLPATSALFRLLDLPFHDRARLAQAVGPAIEEHVPVSLDEGIAAFDYTGEDHTAPILAAIAKNSDIETHRGLLDELGVPSSNLLWAAPTRLSPYIAAAGLSATFSVIDADEDGAVIASFDNGMLSDMRVIARCDLELLTRNILWSYRSLQVSKRTIWLGGSKAGELSAPLTEAGIDGDIKALPNTAPLECTLDVKWNELTALAGLASVAAGEARSSTIYFSDAGALGLKQLVEVAGQFRPLLPWALALFVLASTSLGIDYLGLWGAKSKLESQVEQLYTETMGSGSQGPGRELKMEMLLSRLSGGTSSNSGSQGSALSSLAAISSAISSKLDVELNQFRHSTDGTRIQGHAASFETVTQVEKALRSDGRFSDIEVRDAHAAASGDGVDFLIVLKSALRPNDRGGS